MIEAQESIKIRKEKEREEREEIVEVEAEVDQRVEREIEKIILIRMEGNHKNLDLNLMRRREIILKYLSYLIRLNVLEPIFGSETREEKVAKAFREVQKYF